MFTLSGDPFFLHVSFLKVAFFFHLNCLLSISFPSLSANRNWDKFEDSYRTMLFSNGEKCWNGPDRSLKVMTIMLLDWIIHSFAYKRYW